MTMCVVFGSFGAGVAAANIDPNGAARACARGHAIGSRLGGSDLSYVRRFVPCVVREFRRQLGDTLQTSAALSRDLGDALQSFARASAKHEDATTTSAGLRIFRSRCSVTGKYRILAGDSTPPPVLTSETLSSAIETILFKDRDWAARAPSAVFGFAYRRGVVFHDKSNGDDFSLGVYALECPTAPPVSASGHVTFTDIGVSNNYHPGAHAWRFRTRLVRDGKSLGTGSGNCTHRSGASSNNCYETFHLANGSLTVHIAKFMLSTRPAGGTGTIIRGTAAFRHARGAVTDRAITDSSDRITLRFH
jgi:hypothetical protein